MNPSLSIKKAIKEQVKICIKNTFSKTTQQHISKILLKPNTRVLALVMLFENREKCIENVQSVELCNIYNYKQIYLY